MSAPSYIGRDSATRPPNKAGLKRPGVGFLRFIRMDERTRGACGNHFVRHQEARNAANDAEISAGSVTGNEQVSPMHTKAALA